MNVSKKLAILAAVATLTTGVAWADREAVLVPDAHGQYRMLFRPAETTTSIALFVSGRGIGTRSEMRTAGRWETYPVTQGQHGPAIVLFRQAE
jgi:hypothetical protein